MLVQLLDLFICIVATVTPIIVYMISCPAAVAKSLHMEESSKALHMEVAALRRHVVGDIRSDTVTNTTVKPFSGDEVVSGVVKQMCQSQGKSISHSRFYTHTSYVSYT